MTDIHYIPRPLYMTRVRPFIDQQLIKVFVGQRRVGKSYVMHQVADEIKQSVPHANIIYIDKERLEFSVITNEHTLYQYVCDHLQGDKQREHHQA